MRHTLYSTKRTGFCKMSFQELLHSHIFLALPHDHHVLVSESYQVSELRIHCYSVDGGTLDFAETLADWSRPLQHLPKQRLC